MIYISVLNYMILYVKCFMILDRIFRGCVGLVGRVVIRVEGRGDVSIVMKGVRKIIKNVFFVFGLNRNVLSVG